MLENPEFVWHVTDPGRDWCNGLFINGTVRDEVSLPPVKCPRCGEGWVSDRRLLFTLPPDVRKEVEAIQQDIRIEYDRFQRCVSRWESALRRCGHNVSLEPGDAFGPLLWSVPSIPREHVYWPANLFDGCVVNSDVATVLSNSTATGFSLRPVRLERVGSREATEEPPIPTSGDEFEEEWFRTAPRLPDPQACGQFFQMSIENYSEPSSADGEMEYKKCSTCHVATKDESVDYQKRVNCYRKWKQLPRRHALPFDVFWSHIFWGGFIMSDRLFATLSKKYFNNCQLARIAVIDDADSR